MEKGLVAKDGAEWVLSYALVSSSVLEPVHLVNDEGSGSGRALVGELPVIFEPPIGR